MFYTKATLFSSLFFLFVVLAVQAQQESPNIKKRILFETGSSQLDSAACASLDGVIQQTHPDYYNRITLEGFADDRGDEAYNMKLSSRRVSAVRDYLIAGGVSKASVQIEAKGERPEPQRNQEVQRKKDRAVVLSMQQEHVFAGQQREPQEFKVNTTKDEVFQTRGGVQIIVPAGTLVAANGGRIFGSVTLQVNEYLSKADFIRGGLHSMSDHGLLESGGMFNLQASYGSGREPSIAAGKSIEIIVPADSVMDDMMVFYPSGSAVSQGGFGNAGPDLRWILDHDTTTQLVEAERIEAKFEGVFQKLGQDAPLRNDPDIAFFAQPENEEDLAFLIHRLICQREAARLEKLIAIIPVQEIYIANGWNAMTNASGNVTPVFKRKTMREIRFTDSSFEPFDFNAINPLMLKMKNDMKSYVMNTYRGQRVDAVELASKDRTRQRYRMRVNQLGMVNCDRFLRLDFAFVPKTQFRVRSAEGRLEDMSVCLVFKDINSVMPLVVGPDGTMVTPVVPTDKEAILFAFKTEGEEIVADLQSITISSAPVELEMESMSREEFLTLFKEM